MSEPIAKRLEELIPKDGEHWGPDDLDDTAGPEGFLVLHAFVFPAELLVIRWYSHHGLAHCPGVAPSSEPNQGPAHTRPNPHCLHLGLNRG